MKNGTVTQSNAPLVITGRLGSKGTLKEIRIHFVKLSDHEFAFKAMFPNRPLSAVWFSFGSRRERQYELRLYINRLDDLSVTYRNASISL